MTAMSSTTMYSTSKISYIVKKKITEKMDGKVIFKIKYIYPRPIFTKHELLYTFLPLINRYMSHYCSCCNNIVRSSQDIKYCWECKTSYKGSCGAYVHICHMYNKCNRCCTLYHSCNCNDDYDDYDDYDSDDYITYCSYCREADCYGNRCLL